MTEPAAALLKAHGEILELRIELEHLEGVLRRIECSHLANRWARTAAREALAARAKTGDHGQRTPEPDV